MKGIIRSRKGFTLAEVLVTIAIIAILAAVLVPILTSQIRKSDVSRTAADLQSTRTGMEAFMADVRRVPSSYSQLFTAITTSVADINGDNYPAGLAGRWSGPYVDKPLNAQSNVATGFGGVIPSAFDTLTTGGVKWVVIVVDSLTKSEFYAIDEVLDGDTAATSGRFRLAGDSAQFLALPIQ